MRKYYCIDCKKEITKYRKRCRRCSFKFYKGKNHPNYKHGKYDSQNIYYCLDCKKKISYNTKTERCRSCASKWAWNNRLNRSTNIKHGLYSKYEHTYKYCKCKKIIYAAAKRCHSCENKRRFKSGIMNTKGNKNGQYIHGMNKRKYPKEFSKELKYKIFKRDQFTCQRCHIYPTKLLSAHHIDYNKQNCKEDNLITLCRKCNSEVNKNVDYWFAYFTYIMENFIGRIL